MSKKTIMPDSITGDLSLKLIINVRPDFILVNVGKVNRVFMCASTHRRSPLLARVFLPCLALSVPGVSVKWHRGAVPVPAP